MWEQYQTAIAQAWEIDKGAFGTNVQNAFEDERQFIRRLNIPFMQSQQIAFVNAYTNLIDSYNIYWANPTNSNLFVEIGAGTQSVVKNLFEGLTLYIYFQINPSAVEIVPLAVVKSPVGSIVEIEFELFDKHLYKFLSDVKIYIGRLLPLTESAVNSVSIKILSSNSI